MAKLTSILVRAAFPHLDEMLAPFCFRRKSKQRGVYERNVDESRQEIDVSVRLNPKYGRGADVHVYPIVRVGLSSVVRVALEMLGDPRLLANATDVVIMQTLDSIAPRENFVDWFATGEEGLRVVLEDIGHFIQTWGIPFLTDYSSVKGYIEGYERADPRLIFQQHSYVFVAAAYVVVGSHRKALEVLDSRLGLPGPRAHFAGAFSFVEAALKK